VDDDHVEKVLAVIRQNRRLTVRDFDRKTEDASCCRKICAASADASLLIHEFLTRHETTVVPQPPYSPDLAPADFFLFPKLKSSLKGRRFQTVEEIEENLIRDLHDIPQNTIQDAFKKLKKRWVRCIKSGEECFEGDKFDYVVSKAINLKKKFGFFMDCPRIYPKFTNVTLALNFFIALFCHVIGLCYGLFVECCLCRYFSSLLCVQL